MMATEPLTAASADAPPESLIDRYHRVRALSLALASPLSAEDMAVQTMPEVSPTKWHLAHTTWFFERMVLCAHAEGYEAHDEHCHYLFNSYYNAAGPMHLRPRRGEITRPDVAEVRVYRRVVDEAMDALISARGSEPELAWLIELGLNHEQQHQELLLTDIKHVLASNPLRPAYRQDLAAVADAPREMGWVTGAEGVVEIGAAPSDRFAYDNESPRHRTYLQAHAIADRMVTNGEYRAFIEDGAYRDPLLWLSDGWARVQAEGWTRPLYWDEELATHFTLSGQREIAEHAPISHLSFYEAEAYARWAGYRLPTEAEWEHAAAEAPVRGNTVESDRLACSGAEGSGLTQLYGDAWEWTASAYAPYPGFRPMGGDLGEYNGKFMCNQMTVRGGSCLSSSEHLRATYRSFFYPHDRWQELGLRLAKDA